MRCLRELFVLALAVAHSEAFFRASVGGKGAAHPSQLGAHRPPALAVRRTVLLQAGGGGRVDKGSRALPPKKADILTTNEDIAFDPVRVIVDRPGGQDEQLGIMPMAEVEDLRRSRL
jgi:hypothetical protein